MKLKSLAACGLLLWMGYSAAQAQAPVSQGRGGSVLSECMISLTLGDVFPGSLDDLIARSKYVVEVTVTSAFPAIKEGSGPRSPVSTDFVVAPQRVLKGQLAADRFVVHQAGGQLEGRKRCSNAYPGGLMSPGQRYILFLNDPDEWYRHLQQRDGLQRFVTTTEFLGFVLVERGKVELSHELRFHDGYNGMSAAQFMDEITAKAKAQSR